MNKEFVASNGIILSFDDQGRFMYSGDGDEPRLVGMSADRWWGFTESSRNADALAEYYRAKEDERLGRWRYDRNTVVYSGSGSVRVLDEQRAHVTNEFQRAHFTKPEGELTNVFRMAARAYFDAHPEPKPWHEAKPGEVWVLTHVKGETSAFIVDGGRFESGSWSLPFDALSITAARKIWPQDVPTIDDLSYDA